LGLIQWKRVNESLWPQSHSRILGYCADRSTAAPQFC
jgi:hypothetical protein